MAVRISKVGRRIRIDSDAPLPGLRTTIPGAYESVNDYWTVPLSIESLLLLREKYGSVQVATSLARWERTVQSCRTSMAKLGSRSSARLRILPTAAPRLYKAMRNRRYQLVGARFIADSTGGVLIADEPGLGKTLIALGGILESEVPGPYLVVAPKTASDAVWRREIQRWLPSNHKAVTLPELRYQREETIALTRYTATTWLIVHPEVVQVRAWWKCIECERLTVMGNRQQRQLACGHMKVRKTEKVIHPSYPKLFSVEWGCIIVDESHETLIRRTGVPTQRRRGLDMLKLRSDGIRIAMSGTPFDSKPHQLWGTLNWLDSEQYSAFHRWAELYWQKGGYTGFQIGEFRRDREQMLWDSLGAIALRRTKAEVAKDLPPKIMVGTPLDRRDPTSPVRVWLDMTGKQATAYEAMEKASIAALDSGMLEAVTALAELTRLKQLACCYGDIERYMIHVPAHKCDLGFDGKPCRSCRRDGAHTEARERYIPQLPSNKFDWVIQHLEEWGYPDKPLSGVVIVSFYTGILDLFAQGIEQHFKTKNNTRLCTAITGQTPQLERRKIIDRYNSNTGPRVMLLNVKAGGTAITLDTADRMVFISETRIPDQQAQAEDRIHRVSKPRHCMYYYLCSNGTVDTGTATMNVAAIADTHRLLDGRRGIDYVRQVLDLSHRGSSMRGKR